MVITTWMTVPDGRPRPWSDEPNKVYWIDDVKAEYAALARAFTEASYSIFARAEAAS
jgi:hypothetical protein